MQFMPMLRIFCVAIFCVATSTVAHAADEYDTSEVARVWESVTGTAIDTDTEFISVDGMMLRVMNPHTNELIGSFVWVPSLGTRINTESVTDKTDWGTALNYSVSASFVSGSVFSNGTPHPFVFVGYAVRYETTDPQGNPLQGGIDMVVPWIATESIREADEFVARAEAVSKGDGKGDGKDGGIECHDPTWQGDGGEECCGYLAALQERLGACYDEWYGRIFSRCLPAAAVSGFATFKWCISGCAVVPPPANASCASACLGIGGLMGLEGFIVCMIANDSEYESCLKRERAAYYTDLTNSGCEIRKPEAEYGTNQ